MANIPAFQDNGWLPPGHHPATLNDVIAGFRDGDASHRALLTDLFAKWYSELVALGVTGTLIVDGSYVSAKGTPSDIDVLLVAPSNIEALKVLKPDLAMLLDHEVCREHWHLDVLYFPENSPVLGLLKTAWDTDRDKRRKGVLEVPLC